MGGLAKCENADEGKDRWDSMSAIGIDFGTTNSSVALATGGERVELVTFPSSSARTASFRSVLYLEQVKSPHGVKRVHAQTGPAAIQHYLEAEEKGRLIQSLKSHLSSRSLTGTEIFGRRHRLEELIARMLKDLRKSAEEQFGKTARRAVVGRPVRFVGQRRRRKTNLRLVGCGKHSRWRDSRTSNLNLSQWLRRMPTRRRLITMS